MSPDVEWRTTHGDRVEVYATEVLHDTSPEWLTTWRYRVRAANNRIVETGSEGYTRRAAAITAALRHHPRVEVEE